MSTILSHYPDRLSSPTMSTPSSKEQRRGKWFFLGAFIFACFLFWWLPSILFRLVVHQADPVDNYVIALSIIALFLFVIGYFLPRPSRRTRSFSEPVLNGCCNFAYRATVLLFFPSLLVALHLWYSRIGVTYGSGDTVPRSYQALLYTHLFFGFMFLGSVSDKLRWRRIVLAAILIILPRLIISIHGARFVVAQAVVPCLLIAIGRGWIRLSIKRIVQLALLAIAMIFIPALTRSESLSDFAGRDEIITFFAAGSSLNLFQTNMDLNLNGRCPPLIVSLTAKTIPYGVLQNCLLDISGLTSMPATLGRILTLNDPYSFNGTVSGTGSNYLLDLYLFGGAFAVYLGSVLFGFTCGRFTSWIGQRSLFSGIWAECLTRALFAPRSDLGYVYERIPSLVLATFFVVFTVWAWRFLKRGVVSNPLATIPVKCID